GASLNLDHVIIVREAAPIRFAESGFWTFVGIVNAPEHAVDVKEAVIAALALLTHGQLRVARENVANKNAARVAAETPGVILEGAQIHLVEFLRAIVAEERIFQFPG